MIKKTSLLLAIIIFSYCSSGLAEEIPLTLDEAVAIALRQNHDILLKGQEVKKAKLKIAQARGGLLPTLTFNGGWTDTHGLTEKDLALTTTQASVKQIIYQGGKIVNTIKYNEYGLSVEESFLDQAKLDTIASVKKSFYTLLLARRFSELNQRILSNSQEHLDYLKERYKNGEASQSEILSLESALDNVRQAYLASVNQIEAAQIALNNLLYLDNDARIKPDAELNYDRQEIQYDQAFLLALKNRPEIKRYELLGKQAERSVEIAKADNRPTIYGSWEYFSRSSGSAISSGATLTGGTSSGSSKGWNDYSTLGFVFSWPIFDGWATKQKVEQAIVDVRSARLLKEKAVKDVAEEFKTAYLELNNSLAAIRSSETELKFYKDNLRSLKEKYGQGQASLLEHHDAGLKYEISLFNRQQAVFDYIIAKINFEKANGGI